MTLSDETIVALSTPTWWEFCGNEAQWQVFGPWRAKQLAVNDPMQKGCPHGHGVWYCSAFDLLRKGFDFKKWRSPSIEAFGDAVICEAVMSLLRSQLATTFSESGCAPTRREVG